MLNALQKPLTQIERDFFIFETGLDYVGHPAMKIKLEDADISEIEITIRGNLADKNIQHLISVLKENKLTSKILLFAEEKEILVDAGDILYFEVQERKTFAQTINGRYLCRHTLQEILSLFNNQGIVQISKSSLVNIKYVKFLESEFSGNYIITLKNDEKLMVSRFFMKDFRKAILA